MKLPSKNYLILMLVGAFGILDTFLLILFYDVSINLGVVLPGILGCVFIGLTIFKIENRTVRKLLTGTLIIWVISFLAIQSMIISAQRSDEGEKVEHLIILGAGLKGEKLSPTLESRMKKGLEYLKSYPDTEVIVSGGQGQGGEITEAEAMRRFLVVNGIDESRITKEEKSTNTIENLRLSKKIIMQNNKSHEIMIVTSDFHILRAKMLAERVGLKPYGLPSNTPYYILPNTYLREYFAIIKSFFIDK
ncbi:MAG: YdcF family protein [Thermincolia bacterium]